MTRASDHSNGLFPAGGNASRKATDSLFFAVHPDAETAQRIVELAQALREKHGLSGNPLPPGRVHVTLHHLGDHAGLPASLIEAASAAAARLSFGAFEVCFDRVASFAHGARNRPCVLRDDGETANARLRALHAELARNLSDAGLARYLERRRFAPHATLLYDAKIVAPEWIEPVRWTVDRVTLVHSLLGRGIHRRLAHWPV